ncbi:hypothetical protein RND81_11G000400 [Saponaria officinalis]|uniref:Myb-like domain-containing protein n=1 Tax=Saponaria officinalis TaxID=3572 RepID=A0AAW1HHS5_SAPOF
MAAQQLIHKLELFEDEEQEQQQRYEASPSVCSDSAAGLDLDLDTDVDVDKKVVMMMMNNEDDATTLNKAARLPRWTRQEILVLIQGKKVAENRVRRGRTASTVEPKWATVSSYCKRHGVNRGAVQCRKRWSNLAGDFKKIKEWESQVQDEADSFWLMRNDLRRDRKLPGFFDREVYDILDHKMDLQHSPPLLFDSGRTAPPHDALFSADFDKELPTTPTSSTPLSIPAPTPISAKQYQPFTPDLTPSGADNEKQAAPNPEIGSPSRKRKRLPVEDDTEGGALLQIMEKNGRILSAQLEAHNINLKLDREDRKEHANSLVAVLNKLADALSRIADKL